MNNTTEIFKALGDPARLRIIHLLLQASRAICSCEICDSLVEPQYAVSRNMKVLKFAGLIQERKEGKWVYYYPKKSVNLFSKKLFQALKLLPQSEAALKEDLKRLGKRLEIRKGGKCYLGVQNKELAA